MIKINALTTLILIFLTSTLAEYWKDREAFIKREESRMLGSSIVLSEKENIVNKILMGYKLREYDSGFENPGIFAPGRHFFNSRQDIEASKVFKFIQKLPKGAALHGHDPSIVSQEYIYNLTYKDNLYACTDNERLRLMFLMNPQQDLTCNWTLINDLRKENPSYDSWIRSQLTLDVKNPKQKYPNINIVWKAFMNEFKTVYPMMSYRPVFQERIYQALKELYEDNVMYLEFRGSLPTVYELNGTKYGPLEAVGFYQEAIKQFKADYPDFWGARLIYGPARKVSNGTAENYVKIVKDLKNIYPDLLAGLDLVGQEDVGEPLTNFIPELEEISSHGINFFFHAGETNWYGTKTDFNLIDAILLGSKRIGHGFALPKHPLVLEIVKEREIAIEICPISNQVLMLLDDFRNHPGASLIADGFPVVISYDDPSFWGTKGLSYDFYMAFMGMASRNADLKVLKQLAKNSLIYSAMQENEKKLAVEAWEKQWGKFIDEVIFEKYGNSVYNISENSV